MALLPAGPMSGTRAGSVRLARAAGPAPPRSRSASCPAGALSLVRQLEHRLDALSDLAEYLAQRRQAHVRQTDQAREQLAKAFRYAEDLARAASGRATSPSACKPARSNLAPRTHHPRRRAPARDRPGGRRGAVVGIDVERARSC